MNLKLHIIILLLSISGFSQNLIPDLSFGDGGKVQTSFGEENSIFSTIALQPDGKIVACGTYHRYSDAIPHDVNQLALCRYNPNGTLDVTFGTDGKILLPIGSNNSNERNNVKVLASGKILVLANQTMFLMPNQPNTNYALLQFNADGTPDDNFGTNGMATADFDGLDFGWHMELQPDGKIIIAGTSFQYGSNDTDFAVSRYNANGSKDTSFGLDGLVRINFGHPTDNTMRTDEDAKALKIQSDGKIIIAGYTYQESDLERAKFALTRLNLDGSFDNNFGINGKVYTNFTPDDEIAESLQLLPDGKIVAFGTLYYNDDDNAKIIAVKYNSNGTLDTNFANNGKLIAESDNPSPENYVFGSNLLENGKLLAIGGGNNNGVFNAFLFRINADGSQDDTFGSNGYFWIDPQQVSVAKDLIVSAEGKIILGGITISADGSNGEQFVLWQFIEQALAVQALSGTNFSVSPNPFQEKINADFNLDQSEFLTFELFDQSSRKIQKLFSGNFNQGQNSKQLEVLQLPNGIYFLKIQGKKTSKTIRIIK